VILRQSSRYAALTARIAAGSADSRWYTRRGHPTSSGGLVTLIACWVWIPSGGLLVLALSNGYMGLALFEAAPAPLPRCPSTRAGHHCSVPSTLGLTGACVAQKEGFLARGGLRQATVWGATCSLPPQATWRSRSSKQHLPRSPAAPLPVPATTALSLRPWASLALALRRRRALGREGGCGKLLCGGLPALFLLRLHGARAVQSSACPAPPLPLYPCRPPLLCPFDPGPHWRLRCAEGGRSGERGAAASYCAGGYPLSSS
jgi:hypothetical protein